MERRSAARWMKVDVFSIQLFLPRSSFAVVHFAVSLLHVAFRHTYSIDGLLMDKRRAREDGMVNE